MRLLASGTEWNERNRLLAREMAALAGPYLPEGAQHALDVGTQSGRLADRYQEEMGLEWIGVDPVLDSETRSPGGIRLVPGAADRLPFGASSFDMVVLANVYEHIQPAARLASMAKMRQVLRARGIVVGQIPNPYYPIESHSRLPFLGWLPYRLQLQYYKLSPATYEHDFFVVTPKHLTRDATAAGFEVVTIRRFNYPPEVMPEPIRPLARALERPMRLVPWAWQFVLRKL